MPDQPAPQYMQRRFGVTTVNEMWYKILTEGDPLRARGRHLFGLLPQNPRCASCHSPFAGIGGLIGRLVFNMRQSPKNPRYCNACDAFTTRYPGGAEVELSILFVDVRGSTALAESMSAAAFSALMNRFYEAAVHVLVRADAFIDKFVGDAVTALFVPGYAGPAHARRALDAGRALLRATGHADPSGPWVPVGVGVHTGRAWVGSVSGASGAASDFTALGDSVNVAARLASEAAAGELVVSDDTWRAAQPTLTAEQRELTLKGKSDVVGVRVLHVN